MHGPDNLVKDTPPIYRVVKNDKSVKAIAEYPILDLNLTPYALTLQQYHQKYVYNANDSSITKDEFNQSIGGLNDVQAIGVLKERGITHILTHAINLPSNNSLNLYGGLNIYKSANSDKVRMYAIDSSVASRRAALVTKFGFNEATVDEHQISHHVLSVPGALEIVPARHELKIGDTFTTSFDVAAYSASTSNVKVYQGNTILWQGNVTKDAQHVTFVAKKEPIYITTSAPIDITDLSALPN
jgi:hypothetical protein